MSTDPEAHDSDYAARQDLEARLTKLGAQPYLHIDGRTGLHTRYRSPFYRPPYAPLHRHFGWRDWVLMREVWVALAAIATGIGVGTLIIWALTGGVRW